ncbi:MAG: hypothetical protein KDK37_08125 [Leptospiraceae bacterium]|nr:hypothetical protein [Leptospiraceae bacterium]
MKIGHDPQSEIEIRNHTCLKASRWALGLFVLTLFLGRSDALFAAPPESEDLTTDYDASDASSDFDLSELDNPYHFGGFVRQSIEGIKPYYPYDKGITDITSFTRLRLTGQYSSGPWEAEVSGNGDFIFTNHPESPAFPILYESEIRNRALSLETQKNKGDYLIRGDVHRMYIGYRGQSLHATIGRQAISWGEGRLLNPMDLITPVGPLIQDIEDVPGADALNFSYFFNSYDSLQLVLVPYTSGDNRDVSKLRSENTTAVVRYKATFGNLDAVVLGGQQFRSYIWGAELNLTMWDAGFRFAYLGRQENEAFHKDWLAEKDTHQFVLGASYAFWGKLRTNLEFFYNDRPYGDDSYIPELQQTESDVAIGEEPPGDDLAFFRTSGRILTRNHSLLQGSVGYDITELLTADLFAIWDTEGGSLLYGPQFSYNAANEVILVAGARLYNQSKHPEEGEFYGAPPQAFLYLRWHF